MPNNIVKYEQLKDIAEYSWTKTKERYDDAFIDAEIPTGEKKITFTKRKSGTTKDVSLEDYARLQDRNKFKQDVSVDDAEIKNNVSIGKRIGMVDPADRSLGARNLSSSLFTDRYVSKLRVYLENTYNESRVAVHVWAIKKGDTKREDTTARSRVHSGTPIDVSSGNNKKWIDIPINETFVEDTYFIFRTSAHVNVEAVSNIAPENAKHVINLNANTPPLDGVGQNLDLSDERINTTAYVEIFGRIGIKDLNSKINQLQVDGSKYVLKSETTDTGGVDQQGKVVKLGADGKLHTNMLPELAINRVLTADSKNAALNMRGQNADQLQLGDVVVITGEQNRVYMCKDEATGIAFENAFIELSLGNGTVKTVNGQSPDGTGNVVIDLEHLQKVKEELNKKISEITLKNDNKKLVITKATGATSELDLTSAFAATNISYSGQIGTTTKNNVQEAIDALNTEVNRGVKSIKSGTPGTNGDIDVTATQSGTGISIRFGTNGTPVEIATYMTTEEVTAIKELFV